MWMGGVPPLGYECRDHKLIVIPTEAETVRHIFRRYAALGSVRLLQQDLNAAGIRSKCWTSTSGRNWGGKPLARGALYWMLRNRIYCGQIVHKNQHYPGDHEAIIEEPLWEEVQAKLYANAVERSAGERVASPSLLAGLLYDGQGHHMSPSHAVKNGMRYRYYVSQPLLRSTRGEAPASLRIAAAEVERIVLSGIGELLSDPGRFTQALGPYVQTAGEQQQIPARAGEVAVGWSQLGAGQLRPIIAMLCRRVTLHSERIDIEITGSGLCAFLREEPAGTEASEAEDRLLLSFPARLCRVGQGKRLVIDAAAKPGSSGKPDPKLIKLLVRAHRVKTSCGLIPARASPTWRWQRS
jgi:site-specific DNA recombinase